jgi:hypothetical protein
MLQNQRRRKREPPDDRSKRDEIPPLKVEKISAPKLGIEGNEQLSMYPRMNAIQQQQNCILADELRTFFSNQSHWQEDMDHTIRSRWRTIPLRGWRQESILRNSKPVEVEHRFLPRPAFQSLSAEKLWTSTKLFFMIPDDSLEQELQALRIRKSEDVIS